MTKCSIYGKFRLAWKVSATSLQQLWLMLASKHSDNDVINRHRHGGFILKMFSTPKCVAQVAELPCAATGATWLTLASESRQRAAEERLLLKTSTETQGDNAKSSLCLHGKREDGHPAPLLCCCFCRWSQSKETIYISSIRVSTDNTLSILMCMSLGSQGVSTLQCFEFGLQEQF